MVTRRVSRAKGESCKWRSVKALWALKSICCRKQFTHAVSFRGRKKGLGMNLWKLLKTFCGFLVTVTGRFSVKMPYTCCVALNENRSKYLRLGKSTMNWWVLRWWAKIGKKRALYSHHLSLIPKRDHLTLARLLYMNNDFFKNPLTVGACRLIDLSTARRVSLP